jgi:hydroxyacylglutathione hydrolase
MAAIATFIFNDFQENTYVIHDETGACIIIDPGCYYEHERKEITDFISDRQLTSKLIVNTHGHLDHVFGNRFLAEKYNIDIAAHPQEIKILEAAPEAGRSFGFTADSSPQVGRLLQDGDTVLFGNTALKVIFTPGHAPGEISLYSGKDGFLISGDVLFRESIGRTDLPGGDMDVLMDSIINRLLVLPDETVVYSGHGPTTTILHERQHNPFVQYYRSGK